MTGAGMALGKWPRLLVAGDRVTEVQANEILIRTASTHMHSNDRPWLHTVHAVLGLEADPRHGFPTWASMEEVQGRLRMLELEYLGTARIASSYIGGPHGWCDWDGRIGCTGHNIGKWPEMREVQDELSRIAVAFPWLSMQVQLVADEGAGSPTGRWRVADGRATLTADRTLLTEPTDSFDPAAFIAMMSNPFSTRERGVSVERLRAAVAQVEAGAP